MMLTGLIAIFVLLAVVDSVVCWDWYDVAFWTRVYPLNKTTYHEWQPMQTNRNLTLDEIQKLVDEIYRKHLRAYARSRCGLD